MSIPEMPTDDTIRELRALPRTEAGMALLRMLQEEWFLAPKMELGSDWPAAILAIEAEAEVIAAEASLPHENGLPQPLRLRPLGERPLFPGDPDYPAAPALLDTLSASRAAGLDEAWAAADAPYLDRPFGSC